MEKCKQTDKTIIHLPETIQTTLYLLTLFLYRQITCFTYIEL